MQVHILNYITRTQSIGVYSFQVCPSVTLSFPFNIVSMKEQISIKFCLWNDTDKYLAWDCYSVFVYFHQRYGPWMLAENGFLAIPYGLIDIFWSNGEYVIVFSISNVCFLLGIFVIINFQQSYDTWLLSKNRFPYLVDYDQMLHIHSYRK